MAALRAQRHANAKLIRPLRHRIRDHAIQPHCRQRQRQHRKRAKEPRHQVLLLPFLLVADPVLQILHCPLTCWSGSTEFTCAAIECSSVSGAIPAFERTRICVHIRIDKV